MPDVFLSLHISHVGYHFCFANFCKVPGLYILLTSSPRVHNPQPCDGRDAVGM